jgi:hypothetical protein
LTRNNHENQHLVTLLRRLCEAELSDDAMICHDGGFRYSGDFMSMEQDLIEPAAILGDAEYEALLERGHIEEVSPELGRAGGFRVSVEGRRVAYAE